MGTCVLHVMWGIAGARSMRRLMAIHPGASQPSRPSSPRLTAVSRPEEREQDSANSSWMGTLYDNHQHFPSEDNTQGSLPELNCTATRAYGANLVWRVWWKWPHAPLNLLARPPEDSRSLCVSPFSHFLYVSLSFSLPQSFALLFPAFPTCATNHLCGCPQHLLSFGPSDRIVIVHKWRMVTVHSYQKITQSFSISGKHNEMWLKLRS